MEDKTVKSAQQIKVSDQSGPADFAVGSLVEGKFKILSVLESLTSLAFEDCSGLDMRTVGSLANLRRLTNLDVSNCPIHDDVLAKLTALPCLTHLVLRGTKITNACAPELSKAQGLIELVISHTELSDGSMQ